MLRGTDDQLLSSGVKLYYSKWDTATRNGLWARLVQCGRMVPLLSSPAVAVGAVPQFPLRYQIQLAYASGRKFNVIVGSFSSLRGARCKLVLCFTCAAYGASVFV
jgi:hypothetical protein